MNLATLERQVLEQWERERGELREGARFMRERVSKIEGEQLRGMTTEDAALEVIKAHGRCVHYFDLYAVLRVAVLAPEENPVSLYHNLRKSEKVRVNGCHFCLPLTKSA